ncbi:cytochrome P450 [Streptomyces sp. NBC_01381]|uniref:cytochrome P450 n=1 Tax=Streptomyces sp. NBC_01381 TaxID=2903845 RepID=UPI0022543F62|nr:cytochrome P450 [Streptomyces sp. NBC_01381]MCX4671899.1 cytochrome P450 [Streptomyces sp. NBC_01381]
MTTAPVPPPGCPAHDSGQPVPLHTAQFAADPHAFYAYMRHHGPATPVELAPGVEATLVTDYGAALDLLQNPAVFRKDPHGWQALSEGRIPADSPVLPLLAPRPNCMFTDGAPHLRLRQAVTDSLARISDIQLSRNVERVAEYLIAQFSARGSADLLNDYAKPFPLFMFNELFGCPPEIGDRVMFGIGGMFDGVNAEQANQVLVQAVGELVALKRDQPGEDVTSWLMEHPAQLNDMEMVHQLVLLLGAGAEPLRGLLGNTLHHVFTNERFARSGLLDEALDDTLWRNPPMANYAPHYPAVDTDVAGHKVRAGELVMVSFAAANASLADQAGSNRSHLAWSAGPHACPSKDPARLITLTAIEHLLNELPDVELAVPEESLAWRPGPFNRALAQLPVRFGPVKPRASAQPQTQQPETPRQPQAPQRSVPSTEQGNAKRPGRWSAFLTWLQG